jgi:hypothetical protein
MDRTASEAPEPVDCHAEVAKRELFIKRREALANYAIALFRCEEEDIVTVCRL